MYQATGYLTFESEIDIDMDALQLHLLINHYPMILTIIGTILLLIGYWRNSDSAKRFSLWIFFIVALICVAVFGSGEVAGHNGGTLVSSTGVLLRQHQEAARLAFLLVGCTGISAAFGLIMMYRKSGLARWVMLAVLVLSLVSSVIVTRTTLMGRQIKSAATVDANNANTDPEK